MSTERLKALREVEKRARQRALSYGVLDSAPCEKCKKDCRKELDGWIIFGTCDGCRKPK